VNKKK